jgi:hypothetical protein
MRFSPEWLAAQERRAAQRIGNVEIIGGCATRKGAPVRTPAAVEPPPVYHLVGLCRGMGLPEPVPEYRFHPGRRWRFDYAWPLVKLALEIDGGVWTQGRHTRGAGAIEDQAKLSEAAILGWRVLYAVPDDLRTGLLLDRVQRALR